MESKANKRRAFFVSPYLYSAHCFYILSVNNRVHLCIFICLSLHLQKKKLLNDFHWKNQRMLGFFFFISIIKFTRNIPFSTFSQAKFVCGFKKKPHSGENLLFKIKEQKHWWYMYHLICKLSLSLSLNYAMNYEVRKWTKILVDFTAHKRFSHFLQIDSIISIW